jgi:hypothetical protein
VPFGTGSGNFHDEGPFEITGGTGRLAGATGEGTVVADGNVWTQQVNARYDGVIRFSAKDPAKEQAEAAKEAAKQAKEDAKQK